jgi:uncharacterized protein YoxC
MSKKIKTLELLDTKVEMVSFVKQGANGQSFNLFKSVDGKPPTEEQTTEKISEEEINIFKKVVGFVTAAFKKPKEEELEMGDVDKILKKLDGVTESVKKNSESIEELKTSVEKGVQNDPDGDDEAGDDAGDSGNGDAADGAGSDADTGADAGGDADAGKDKVEKGNSSADTASIEKVLTAVNGLSEAVKKNSEEIEKIAKARVPSNSIEKDEGNDTDPKEDELFKGIF